MKLSGRADAIDARVAFWAYSVLAATFGLILTVWIPRQFAGQAGGELLDGTTLSLATGSLLMFAACSAAAFAQVEDPPSRRRSLGWFTIGHGALLLVVLVHRTAIPDAARDGAVWTTYLLTGTLFYFWYSSEGEAFSIWRGTMWSGTGGSASERLRSAYERQLRQAAAQEERNRLARDLHDSIKQQIFAAQTSAATAQVRFESDPSGARQALDQVRRSTRDAMSEMEAMLDNLRATPLENATLAEALKKQCEALALRTGAQVDFSSDRLPASEVLPPGAHQAIFRVGQEALANVARHARAAHVEVKLFGLAGEIGLWVKDDGSGFDMDRSRSGMGLDNMRARSGEFGGRLEIESRPGEGTSVLFGLPYLQESANDYRMKAAGYGVFIVLMLAFGIWQRDAVPLAMAALFAIGFWRQARAWTRVRKAVLK
jgi:signal transduction histidine kinase